MKARELVVRAVRREPPPPSRAKRVLTITGIVVLAVGAAAAVGALLVRDQISRHRRNLFSDHPLRRLAALGYLAGSDASIDNIRLLRDYIGWESRPLIRRRAEQILARMERQAAEPPAHATGEVAG